MAMKGQTDIKKNILFEHARFAVFNTLENLNKINNIYLLSKQSIMILVTMDRQMNTLGVNSVYNTYNI